jgi:hypothetical protein
MSTVFTAAQEKAIRRIAREEATLVVTAALTPGATQAKAPASTKASSTTKENTFVRDVIAGGRKHPCATGACEKTFRTVERAAAHWHPGDAR